MEPHLGPSFFQGLTALDQCYDLLFLRFNGLGNLQRRFYDLKRNEDGTVFIGDNKINGADSDR
ncbi:hypothetical protein NE675_12340, partial [Megasphaera massiliensis]